MFVCVCIVCELALLDGLTYTSSQSIVIAHNNSLYIAILYYIAKAMAVVQHHDAVRYCSVKLVDFYNNLIARVESVVCCVLLSNYKLSQIFYVVCALFHSAY